MDLRSDDAVTPVVGTVLILLITMAGMGAVLAWGAPAVQGIQDQSSDSAMQGEFSDIRLSTLVLMEVDSSRLRSVALSNGEIALEPGSRFAIHAVHNDTFPGGGNSPDCDVRVTGWAMTSDTLTVNVKKFCGDVKEEGVALDGEDDLAFQLDEMVGSSVQSRPSIDVTDQGGDVYTVQSTGDDFSEGDWRLRLVDKNDDAHVQVFILSTHRIAWHLQTSVTDLDLYVEGGALFRVESPQVFNLASAQVGEDLFGSGDYLFELPTYSGSEIAITSPADPEVFLQLQGSHGRIAGTATERIRYDISGELAESWCNHLVFRNDDITAGTYAEDSAATCEDGDADGVRSLTYEPTADTFSFDFIHKRINVNISP